MKTIALLTLAAIFAAVATAAPVPPQLKMVTRFVQKAQKQVEFHRVMQKGRRLEEAEYVKLTCKKDFVGVVPGMDGNCNKESTAAFPMAFPANECIHIEGETNSLKYKVNGTKITMQSFLEDKKCSKAASSEMEFEDNVCAVGVIFGVYKGDALGMETGGTKDDCSDVKPLAGGMVLIPDRCLPGEDESFKVKCSSDKVELQHFTDTSCGTKGKKEEHKEGECFNINGAMGRSFFTLAMALPTIALLYLQ